MGIILFTHRPVYFVRLPDMRLQTRVGKKVAATGVKKKTFYSVAKVTEKICAHDSMQKNQVGGGEETSNFYRLLGRP